MEYSQVSGAPLSVWQPVDAQASPMQPPVPGSAPATQSYLDALPIAAGVLTLAGGTPCLFARNAMLARIEARAGPAFALALGQCGERHFLPNAAGGTFAWQEPGLGARSFEVHVRPLRAHPQFGPRAMLTLIDRTTALETERWLRLGMLHDSLTGLPNRVAFGDAVDAAIACSDRPDSFAVFALDLTRFSRINEAMGSLAGDELIITVASRLKSVLSREHVLARMAADEFALLVPLVGGTADALRIARGLQEALTAPLHLSDLEIKVDCAVGCAVWQEPGRSSADIVRNAQFALKRAKRSGGIEIYQPGEANRARRRFALETDLRRAIEADRLDLAFQPLVDLATRRVTGFEALARWDHPEHGAVPPTEFIAVAEQSGLIVPLGRWVMDRAIGTLVAWDKAAGAPLPIYIGINVSAVQLARDSVPAILADALRRHGIGGERLTLELTESSIIADPVRASSVLDALKALSCRVAMDDFGTGHSSLASLQRLPIDVLKIDRQFVCGMMEDRDSTAIVRAILSLASALGMTTIAEGIETPETAHLLGALGCATGQGFHLGRPMPADEALAFLTAHRAS